MQATQQQEQCRSTQSVLVLRSLFSCYTVCYRFTQSVLLVKPVLWVLNVAACYGISSPDSKQFA